MVLKNRFALVSLAILFTTLVSAASSSRITREQYIAQYHGIAQKKMKDYGIPASITLAQGILESDCGNSKLATKANNHFGIKCHEWTGPSMRLDDDKRNECFRKYKKVEDSYDDHSLFLTKRQRYAFLFELKPTDYKGWARGLKKAGYATNPKYADILIKIIEEEELWRFDKGPNGEFAVKQKTAAPGILREVNSNNNVKFVVAKEGETLTSLTKEFGMRTYELPHYNDLSKGTALEAGEKVYIRPKRNRTDKDHKFHKVEPGETMHDISQQYGVKLKSLYNKNRMEDGEEPAPGEVIFLRYKKPKELD